MIGSTLGHDEIIELLGAGGIGDVYRARDTKLDRYVAIKVLPAAVADDPERLARFEREAKTVAGLNHPNIVVLHSVERHDLVGFITMELVGGCDLTERIAAGGMPLDELLDVAIPLADAVGAAHQNGITHRDLKPSNVMISDDGRVKVLDFGLATSPSRTEGGAPEATDLEETSLETELGNLTQAGRVLGTVAYMAPEQADGTGADHRSDVFALGIMLYEMATGVRPFRAGTRVSLLSSIATEMPPPISELRPQLPDGLERIVRRCLEKKPDDRYQSAVDLRNDLREVATGAGFGAGAAQPGGSPVHALARRAAWIGAAAVVILMVAIAYQFFGSGRVAPLPGSLAVMPFENLTDVADEQQLAGMMTDLLRSNLSQSKDLTVVSSYRLYDIYRQVDGDSSAFDLSMAGEVARRAGAELMVLGRVRTVGGEVVVVTELVSVANARTLASPQATGAAEGEVFAMAATLAGELRRQLVPSTGPGLLLDEAVEGTQIVDAQRAFTLGEGLLRNGNLQGAITQFAVAVRHDPDFHRPWYQLAMLGQWTDRPDLVQAQASRQLAELIDKFPDYERPAVEGLLRASRGDLSDAIPMYEAYLRDRPDDKFALYVLGEIYAHSGRDYNQAEAARIYELVLELDPRFALAYLDLPYNYAFSDDVPRAYEAIARGEAEDPALAQESLAFLAALEGDFDAGA